MTKKLYVGIDVAKSHWDVAIEGESNTRRFKSDKQGAKQLTDWLKELTPTLICLEATGGYEAMLVEWLHSQGFALRVMNPRQIRDFARAIGQLAKTDKIDALVIARFGATIQPDPQEPTSENQRRLHSLRARRQQIVQMIVQEKNRLSTVRDLAIRELIQQAIKFYEEQLREINEQLTKLTQSDPEFQQRHKLLVSVPGIGNVTATNLIADLPELGAMNRGQAAKLVGIAPINRDSGSLRGKRMIGGGRPTVRRGLFMATLVATRHNRVIREHYQQLLKRGKAKMTALVACMRKLLLIINAIIKNKTEWNENYFA